MIHNKKGLSEIVVTLILVLLAIVAVGVVWIVVNNVLKGGEGKINLASSCSDINVEPTVVTNSTSDAIYSVTMIRSASGDEIGGVKVIISNETGSWVHPEPGNIAPLATKTITITMDPLVQSGVVTNANKVEIIPYFTDASGVEQLCSVAYPLEF